MENKQPIKMCALNCQPECKEVAHAIGTLFGLVIAPVTCAAFWFLNYKFDQSKSEIRDLLKKTQ